MKKWKCTVCGYIHAGETPPEECPVCGADRSKFVELTGAEADAGEAPGATISAESGPFGKVISLMLQNHIHPIAVHTPNGIVPAAVLFLLLALVMNFMSFEKAAFYNMAFVLVAMPMVLFSGFIEWQKHYMGTRTPVFFIKIGCGAVVLVISFLLVLWRIFNPGVAAPESSVRWVYFLLHLVALGAVGLAGHLGGKLVFDKKK